MDLPALLAVAEEGHRSETPFFVAGGLLAAFAVLISALGFTRPDFPSADGAARRVMGLSVLLVALALAMAVYVSV